MHATQFVKAAATTVFAATALFGQTITMSAVAQSDLRATANNATGTPTTASLPAGADVSNGVELNAQQNGAASIINVFAGRRWGQSVGVGLSTVAWTQGGTLGASAGSGRSEVLVQVTLDQPMTLDVLFFGEVLSCQGAVTGTAEIDVGNDGTVELQVMPDQTLFASDQLEFKLAMPAGTTEVLLSVELDLPPSLDGVGRFVQVQSGISLRPGHAEVTWEGAECGARLSTTLLLDNETVQFWLGGEQLGDLPFLLFGADRQTAPLPIAPGCNLLVTPDVVMPIPFWTAQDLPLGLLPPGTQLFAQGAILRPQAQPLSPAGVFLSQRLAIEIF